MRHRQPATGSNHGRPLTVRDIKERLVQLEHSASLLLWPPNLFAFTSYNLHLSGAYQLVVSPPAGDRDLCHWPPKPNLLRVISERLAAIANSSTAPNGLVALHRQFEEDVAFASERVEAINIARMNVAKAKPNRQMVWTFLVRRAALQWRKYFEDLKGQAWLSYLHRLRVRNAAGLQAVQSEIDALPTLLRVCWEVFGSISGLEEERNAKSTEGSLPIGDLLCNDHRMVSHADRERWLGAVTLLTMHAIADDTCVGWGILGDRPMAVDFLDLTQLDQLQQAHFHDPAHWDESLAAAVASGKRAMVRGSLAARMAARHLRQRCTMATVDAARARILPKRHNPDVGITLRSLSSNLAFHHSPIDVAWQRDSYSHLARRLTTVRDAKNQHGRPETFTMLLLPFPMEVHTRDFTPVNGVEAGEALDNRSGYGFFRYVPDRNRNENILDKVKSAIASAREEEATVDMIVLPECALAMAECEALSKHLASEAADLDEGNPVSVYIAGVRERKSSSGRFKHNNLVRYGYRERGKFRDGHQHKHHRWQLNKSQIEQYGLGRRLDVGTRWWEAINVERRQVSFINIGDGITLCPLICEDLARQDPIADLIRQVGPSLVVTILMDGPQHSDRWSSRYAAILSEDPGSAVLALTSFGMVRRWNTRFGRLSRVVALWKDKEDSREIELDAGATGILLTLRVESECEVIADGRLEMCPTSKIVLTGVNQVYPRSAPPPPDAQSLARSSASAASEKRL